MKVKDLFKLKGVYHTSMKKEKRFAECCVENFLKLNLVIALVHAGNRGYCNHVMAKLYEIVDYSLYSLQICSLGISMRK